MRAALLLALGVAGAGCELIADIPDPSGALPDDAAVDTPPALECTESAQCTAIGAPICDLATNTCGGCIADSECASNVCLQDGTCAEATRFVYAAAAGTGDACTIPQPCSIDTAVTKLTVEKDIVKLAPGTYTRSTDLTMSLPGTIAGGGSTLVVDGPIGTIGVSANGAVIHIVGLAITATPSNAALRCQIAGGELHLERVRVTGGNAAIFATCPVEIDRSVVSGATLYSLYVMGQPVVIRNSYFVAAGTMPDFTVAAVHLQDVPSGTIEHTTIAHNIAQGPSGLRCPGSAAVTVRNSIAWGNVAPGVDATCTVDHSVVDPGYTGGTANMAVDPQFVDAMAKDFHLSPSSPAAGLGDPAVRFAIDADGDPRPQPAGSAPDPGADEIP